jgi:hypothetical protein
MSNQDIDLHFCSNCKKYFLIFELSAKAGKDLKENFYCSIDIENEDQKST